MLFQICLLCLFNVENIKCNKEQFYIHSRQYFLFSMHLSVHNMFEFLSAITNKEGKCIGKRKGE